MKAFPAPCVGERGKFLAVIRAFPTIWEGTILDVGCRSGLLRDALVQEGFHHVNYWGLDLYPPAHIRADLGKGMPFKDHVFDVVVALDVLEHVDDIHLGFQELCRVSKKWVVISLPNVYEFRGRLKFVMGKPLSGKYGLPPEPPMDRHRWLFSLYEAKTFCQGMAQTEGFRVVDEGCLVGPRRFRLLGSFVAKCPNLLCTTYLCLLEKA